jgi:hypothetical protein
MKKESIYQTKPCAKINSGGTKPDYEDSLSE